jgi:hypothetical protein
VPASSGGDEQQPPRHAQGGHRNRAAGLWGFAACTAPGTLRGPGIELGGAQPHGVPLACPATPAVPLSLGATPLPEPAQHIAGLARLGVQGQSRWGAPHHAVGLLPHRCRHTAALAIAAGRHHDLPGVPRIPRQGCPATAVRHAHLRHAAGQEGLGQMAPPVVPGATRLAEGTRGHPHEAPHWGRTRPRGRLWSIHQLAQEPAQPGVTAAQALTPGRLREVGEPSQYGPGTSLHTGFRSSEWLSLTWEGVDFRRQTITVQAAYAKNGESRSVPMNTVLTMTLKAVRMNISSTGPVFCSRQGTPYRSFRTVFKRAV